MRPSQCETHKKAVPPRLPERHRLIEMLDRYEINSRLLNLENLITLTTLTRLHCSSLIITDDFFLLWIPFDLTT